MHCGVWIIHGYAVERTQISVTKCISHILCDSGPSSKHTRHICRISPLQIFGVFLFAGAQICYQHSCTLILNLTGKYQPGSYILTYIPCICSGMALHCSYPLRCSATTVLAFDNLSQSVKNVKEPVSVFQPGFCVSCMCCILIASPLNLAILRLSLTNDVFFLFLTFSDSHFIVIQTFTLPKARAGHTR